MALYWHSQFLPMIALVINKNQYSIPETWDEVPPKDFIKLYNILSTETEIISAKVKLIYTLGNIKTKDFFGSKYSTFLQSEILLFAETYNPQFFDTVFNHNPLPIASIYNRLEFLPKKYLGPQSFFADCTGDEIDKAYYFFDYFQETKDTLALTKFFVSLWRPYEYNKKYKKNIRIPFDESLISTHASEIAPTPQNVDTMTACAFIFKNIMASVAQQDIWSDVFKSTGNQEEQSSTTDWGKIFRSIASDKIGNLSEIKKMSFPEILNELQYLEEQRELLSEQTQTQNI